MQNGDEASPSIILAVRAILMKMLVTLELRGIFWSNFVYYCILTCPTAGMRKVTRLLRASIWPVKLLVKMLKTL